MYIVPYYKQEKDYTCGPAVARMILEGLFDLKVPEQDLEALLHTTAEAGTDRVTFMNLLKIVPSEYVCAIETGVNGSIVLLQEFISNNYAVVVNYYYDDHQKYEGHYAIVQSISTKEVILQDPWVGPHYKMSLQNFLEQWHSGNGMEQNMPAEIRSWVAIKNCTN